MALLTRRAAAPLLPALLALLVARPATAKVYLTQEAAIRLAFPEPQSVDRRTLYLDDAQAKRAAESAGAPVEVRVVPYYVGHDGTRVTGYAYFDTHLVRTLPETVMVRLTAEGAIVAIDVVSFDEPEDYKVTARWLEQFRGAAPADPKSLRGSIRALTGATLSARAITDAARRVLALHRLFVAPGDSPPGAGAP